MDMYLLRSLFSARPVPGHLLVALRFRGWVWGACCGEWEVSRPKCPGVRPQARRTVRGRRHSQGSLKHPLARRRSLEQRRLQPKLRWRSNRERISRAPGGAVQRKLAALQEAQVRSAVRPRRLCKQLRGVPNRAVRPRRMRKQRRGVRPWVRALGLRLGPHLQPQVSAPRPILEERLQPIPPPPGPLW